MADVAPGPETTALLAFLALVVIGTFARIFSMNGKPLGWRRSIGTLLTNLMLGFLAFALFREYVGDASINVAVIIACLVCIGGERIMPRAEQAVDMFLSRILPPPPPGAESGE